MFTVVTHRGQEIFQVPIMGYINVVAYMQREINNILRGVRDCARVYVDDIICGAKSLDDLFFKLRILFKTFVAYKISIKPTKSFLNYPDVSLLGQRVNFLGLTTVTEKLQGHQTTNLPRDTWIIGVSPWPYGLLALLYSLLRVAFRTFTFSENQTVE